MSLDLTKIAPQVEDMACRLKAGSQLRQQHLEKALGILNNQADLDGLRQKIARSKTTWLVADPVDALDRHYSPPPLPADFTVIATDGSHIDVDRHRSARCCLINIGSVTLNYGSNPGAALGSLPRLYADDEELFVSPPSGGAGRQQPLEGALLGIKRGIEECRYLAGMAAGLPAGISALALIDGSLILWGLASKDYPEFVVDTLLIQGFLRYLEDMRRLDDKKLALASYISFPRSTDVANTLRVAVCPHDMPDCDRYCAKTPSGQRECDAVAGVQDRELFFNLLGEGERSALFISQSSIVEKYYGEHRVYFFYLRVGDEIARIELPQWVAMDESRLGLAHSLVLDQCRRGQGYPVALSEAHEQAVLTGDDRENFQQLVDTLLADEDVPITTSSKSRSKRTRWV